MEIEVSSARSMKELGARIGALLCGGEVIELIGDVGAGKTTFVKGLAQALCIEEDIQSPSFTISRVYESPNGIVLAHYDFYRLVDPGIMRNELEESVHDPVTVTIIEWAALVEDVLPADTLRITFSATGDTTRLAFLAGSGARSKEIMELL